MDQHENDTVQLVPRVVLIKYVNRREEGRREGMKCLSEELHNHKNEDTTLIFVWYHNYGYFRRSLFLRKTRVA